MKQKEKLEGIHALIKTLYLNANHLVEKLFHVIFRFSFSDRNESKFRQLWQKRIHFPILLNIYRSLIKI